MVESALPISPQSQNFNTNTGISTFNALNVTNDLSVGTGVAPGRTTGFFGGEVGIGTTNNNWILNWTSCIESTHRRVHLVKNGFYTAGRLAITNKADGSDAIRMNQKLFQVVMVH